MNKCQVIPLHGKGPAKHAEPKVTSFSAMLADGVVSVLPEQRHARIYDFHRPILNGVQCMSGISDKDPSLQNDMPQPDR